MALHVLDEANRCLGCKKPMCQEGCPIHTNIPEVIRLLKANQMDDAGRMLFENNPLTTVCSLVCNHEKQCEGHCIRNRMPSHDPVHFSIIEDYISTTYANKMTAGPAPKNGMKAAVVGSGPAGLTIAVLLARWGYDVTIFDARDKIGGVMRYGIPNYRLPDSVLDDFQYRHLELKGIKVRQDHHHRRFVPRRLQERVHRCRSVEGQRHAHQGREPWQRSLWHRLSGKLQGLPSGR